jgi:tRNA (guanosine-2'-O-)-methyltransferase
VSDLPLNITPTPEDPLTPERFARIKVVLDRRQPDLTVVMDRVHKPHNLSAIVRSCDAVGVLEAHAVPAGAPLELPAASSAGASKWVRVRRHHDILAAIHALRATGHRLYAAHPTAGARDFRAPDYTKPTAFLLGSELRGLGDDALALADEAIVIPMAGMVRSLNVSVATALLLFEAQRQRAAAGMYAAGRLDAALERTLLFEWAYPRLARKLKEEGRPYPELGADGSFDADAVPR